MTEKQAFRLYLRHKYPVGTVIQDYTCSEPYTIKNRSVFLFFPNEYADIYLPKDPMRRYIKFLVQDPGRNTRRHQFEELDQSREAIYHYLVYHGLIKKEDILPILNKGILHSHRSKSGSIVGYIKVEGIVLSDSPYLYVKRGHNNGT